MIHTILYGFLYLLNIIFLNSKQNKLIKGLIKNIQIQFKMSIFSLYYKCYYYLN